jgi:dolichol-phosphate mannosyltransferase
MSNSFRKKINSVHFVIPVYNEANISLLLNQIDAYAEALETRYVTVVLIDDGSTLELEVSNDFRNIVVEVLRHEINQGPGAAFRTGFMHLPQDLGIDDYVVTMEGDSTSEISLINRMIGRLEEGDEGYDLILASPYMYGGSFESLSLYRRVLSSAANELTRVILDLRGLWTLSSFFRLYRGSSLIKLRDAYGNKIIESNGFEGVVEVLWKMKIQGFRISEIPSKVSQNARMGKSKMKILRTIRGYLRLWRASFREFK